MATKAVGQNTFNFKPSPVDPGTSEGTWSAKKGKGKEGGWKQTHFLPK
jgi:hypothetical protein